MHINNFVCLTGVISPAFPELLLVFCFHCLLVQCPRFRIKHFMLLSLCPLLGVRHGGCLFIPWVVEERHLISLIPLFSCSKQLWSAKQLWLRVDRKEKGGWEGEVSFPVWKRQHWEPEVCIFCFFQGPQRWDSAAYPSKCTTMQTWNAECR